MDDLPKQFEPASAVTELVDGHVRRDEGVCATASLHSPEGTGILVHANTPRFDDP